MILSSIIFIALYSIEGMSIIPQIFSIILEKSNLITIIIPFPVKFWDILFIQIIIMIGVSDLIVSISFLYKFMALVILHSFLCYHISSNSCIFIGLLSLRNCIPIISFGTHIIWEIFLFMFFVIFVYLWRTHITSWYTCIRSLLRIIWYFLMYIWEVGYPIHLFIYGEGFHF